ncbi:polysaccharide chain length determinant protein (PEP-CTERM system associated) [Rhizomicrobium palustre]|uniref:Polysaccharide chain length determinant protein (PEP-CTERM system associated) n=1 Tax=Rhizomicrobium palustre TaxID=189966 RepID=A0A846MTL8_9PROT|nr:XrtA system polysaccharide chain length determinant [Rhizomicrobium palustre]NIK86706.1 polysaccharide chain length determinant protein (PEP-CTERM system associated) [Rhizomicrobium palustre]
MQSWKLQLLSLIGGGWQFRWWGLGLAWAVCLIGWVAVALIPNAYQSSAKVYIDTDTMMRPLLKGIVVSTDTQQQINVMLRTLVTAPNMERVVRVTNPKSNGMSQPQMQDAVARLTSHVSLKALGTKNLYEVGFTDPNPAYAQSVAQTLLSVMVDSNVGDQRRESDDARSFIDSQIASYEKKIQEADKRKADFRAAHLNVFFGTSDIDEARGAITTAKTAVEEAAAKRNSLRAQLAATPATMDINGPAPVQLGGAGTVDNKRQQLGQARAKLDELRAHFTEDYPDVVAQKQLVARLKSQLTEKVNPAEDGGLQSVANPTYLMLRTKLADEEVNLAVATSRLAEAQKRLDDAGKTAGDSLNIKRQYDNLDRDYQALKKNYEALVERRESANISQAAGDQQSNMVFRIVDPPSLPNRPASPNRLLLNLAVLLAGIAAGLAGAVGLGAVSGRFMTVEQLSAAFALPVLGAVTVARTASDFMRIRRSATYFAAGGGALVALYLVVLVFFHTNVANGGGLI